MLAIAGAILIHAACTLPAGGDPTRAFALWAVGGGLIGVSSLAAFLDFVRKAKANQNKPQAEKALGSKEDGRT